MPDETVYAIAPFARHLNAGIIIALLGGTAVLFLLRWLGLRFARQAMVTVVSLWRSFKKSMLSNVYIMAWIEVHPRTVTFFRARLDSSHFPGLPLSLLFLAFLYILALFGGIVEDVITADTIVRVDTLVAETLTVSRNDTLVIFFGWITVLGESSVLLYFNAVTVVLLWLWHKREYIPALLVSVGGSLAFTWLGKLAFHRLRPEMAIYTEHSYSFPSAHATIAIAFYGFLGYMFMRFMRSDEAWANILFATVLLVLAIGFSRIYLGVHYISDIWSGYLVGSMWMIIGISIAEWLVHKNSNDKYSAINPAVRPISAVLIASALVYYFIYGYSFILTLHTTQ